MAANIRHLNDGATRPACASDVPTDQHNRMTTVAALVTCQRCRATVRFSNFVKRYGYGKGK